MYRGLLSLRLRLHRLKPPRPIRTPTQAAAFIRERGIVLATGRSSLPMLAEAIAGRTLQGSWMANPEVYRIYEVFQGLSDREALWVPLVLGKRTVIHPSLGPAVERVAGDPARRRGLPALAGRLLREVEAKGEVRLDRWGVPTARARKARLALEERLLAWSSEIHSEGGYHTTVLRPWRASPLSRRFRRAAAGLSREEAEDRLILAALRSAVAAPEREVRRWFAFGGARVEVLVADGRVRNLGGTLVFNG